MHMIYYTRNRVILQKGVYEMMELHPFEEMAEALECPCYRDRDVQSNREERTVFPAVTPVGMAYVPFQQWGNIYKSGEGFEKGTMFPILYMPFAPDGGDWK